MESVKPVLLRLAPWTAISLAAALAFGLPGFLAGAALIAIAEALQFLRDRAAIDGAHSVALARRSADAEAMAARLTHVEQQLKEAITPERMQLAREMIARKLGRG